MLKKIMSILLILSFLYGVAYADKYVEKAPSSDQIDLETAIDISTQFIEKLTGVSASELAPYISEYNFGPGYQWMDSTTTDDCWILVFAQTPLGISRIYVLVHGTSGDILSWLYMDTVTGITFNNVTIDESKILPEQATQIAFEHLANRVGVTIEQLENNVETQPLLLRTEDDRILWNYIVSYTNAESECYCILDIDASSGELLSCSCQEV